MGSTAVSAKESSASTDPVAFCERIKEDLAWKKSLYEKEIEILSKMVGMLSVAIKDAENELTVLRRKR